MAPAIIFKVNRSTRISAFFFFKAQCCLWLPAILLLILDFGPLLLATGSGHMAYSPFCGHSDWFRSEQGTTLVPWYRFAGIGGSTSYFSVLAGCELENTQSKSNAVEENKANVQREADMRVKIREASFKPRSIYVWSQVLYFTAFYGGNTILSNLCEL